MATTIHRTVQADPGDLWRAVTDAVLRADGIPLTHVRSDAGPPGIGWRFVARTAVGPLGFDDRMRITQWRPPGDGPAILEVVKEGPVLDGWARATLTDAGAGSCTLEWTEEIRPRLPAGLGRSRPVGLVADAGTRALFAPVLAAAIRSAGASSPGGR